MFDEQDFVADFVVNHFIHQLFRHHDAEAAGPHPMRLPVFDMPDGIFERAGDGGMRQVFAIESGAGVAEIVDDARFQ
jgi:hypothetical protein